MKPANINLITGLAIIVASIVGLFWYGLTFHVFGSKITFSPVQLGFSGWIALGCFGAGLIRGGIRSGFKAAGGFILLLIAAAAIGFLTGRYR